MQICLEKTKQPSRWSVWVPRIILLGSVMYFSYATIQVFNKADQQYTQQKSTQNKSFQTKWWFFINR